MQNYIKISGEIICRHSSVVFFVVVEEEDPSIKLYLVQAYLSFGTWYNCMFSSNVITVPPGTFHDASVDKW